jgi:hypothetical protein
LELYAKLANAGIAVLAVICFTALYNRFGSRKLIGARRRRPSSVK